MVGKISSCNVHHCTDDIFFACCNNWRSVIFQETRTICVEASSTEIEEIGIALQD